MLIMRMTQTTSRTEALDAALCVFCVFKFCAFKLNARAAKVQAGEKQVFISYSLKIKI